MNAMATFVEMGWMPLPPDGLAMCHTRGVEHKLKERASMEEVSIIGVDLAKNVFQVHGAVSWKSRPLLPSSARSPPSSSKALFRSRLRGGRPSNVRSAWRGDMWVKRGQSCERRARPGLSILSRSGRPALQRRRQEISRNKPKIQLHVNLR